MKKILFTLTAAASLLLLAACTGSSTTDPHQAIRQKARQPQNLLT